MANIIEFPGRPVASRLEQALAGCVHACWQTYCDDAVDIEAIARFHRALADQSIGRRRSRELLQQIDAATAWLEKARRDACLRASDDGEYALEDADYHARRAIDIVGGLGLLEQCRERLQVVNVGGEPVNVDMAWRGLEMLAEA